MRPRTQLQPHPRVELEGKLRVLERWREILEASVRTQAVPWCEGMSEERRLAGLAATKQQLIDTKRRFEELKAELALVVQAS